MAYFRFATTHYITGLAYDPNALSINLTGQTDANPTLWRIVAKDVDGSTDASELTAGSLGDSAPVLEIAYALDIATQATGDYDLWLDDTNIDLTTGIQTVIVSGNGMSWTNVYLDEFAYLAPTTFNLKDSAIETIVIPTELSATLVSFDISGNSLPAATVDSIVDQVFQTAITNALKTKTLAFDTTGISDETIDAASTLEVLLSWTVNGDDADLPTPISAYNIYDVQALAVNLAKTCNIMNNIDATITASWNDEAGFRPIGTLSGAFTGSINGLGYKITGLTIKRPAYSYAVGLFGYVNAGANAINNIGLVDCDVTGNENVGSLIGYSVASTSVSNCYSTGEVAGSLRVGGLVGYGIGSGGSNCYSTCKVTGTSESGGFVGRTGSTWTSCFAAGQVVNSGVSIGGFSGRQNTGAATVNCYWDITTSGQASGFGTSYPQAGFVPVGLTSAQFAIQSNLSQLNWLDFEMLTDAQYPTLKVFRDSAYVRTNITDIYEAQAMQYGLGLSYTMLNDIEAAVTREWGTVVADYYYRTNTPDYATEKAKFGTTVGNNTYVGCIDDEELIVVKNTVEMPEGFSQAYSGFVQIGTSASPFNGIFNGNSHKITNLFCLHPASDDISIFGYCSTRAEISKVDAAACVVGNDRISIFSSRRIKSVDKCISRGSICAMSAAGYAAGICAYSDLVTQISNCANFSLIKGYASRFAGIANLLNVTSCSNSYSYVDGLDIINKVNAPPTITSCYDLNGTVVIAGLTHLTAAEAKVADNFVGFDFNTVWWVGIQYPLLRDFETPINGFCGEDFGTITDSYWDTNRSTQTTDAGAVPYTSTEMAVRTNFTDNTWDLLKIWTMRLYPILRIFLNNGRSKDRFGTSADRFNTNYVDRFNTQFINRFNNNNDRFGE